MVNVWELQTYRDLMMDVIRQLRKDKDEQGLRLTAQVVGRIDRRIAEITEDMEKSANRQEGADNED